jgi:D-alanine-D-alanine ligase-like ATP-grasp enzyme
MERFGHFAEFGIDLAIDKDKNLWLIEANVFPSFKGFKTMDLQTYLGIRYTPFLYALSLTQFGE